MRRLYRINSVPDFSGLDEPILLAGSTPLSIKNIIAVFMAVAIAGAGFQLGGPEVIVKPFPMSIGLMLGIAGGLAVVLWSTLSGPDRSGLPLTALLLSGPRLMNMQEKRKRIPAITVKADEDTRMARIELEGDVFDPSSGRPLDRIDVAVDSETYSLDTKSGRYYLELELERGIHEIRLLLPGSRIVLRRYIIRVV